MHTRQKHAAKQVTYYVICSYCVESSRKMKDEVEKNNQKKTEYARKMPLSN